jgi:hypothetical protein
MILDNVFYNVENPLGNRKEIPKEPGLYLVGNTIFNPMTETQFFLVKIGMSTNTYNRMVSYSTQNPMMFHIDYKIINCDSYDNIPRFRRRSQVSEKVKEIETLYHQAMEKMNFHRFEYAQEWFIVDRETYMKICEKKFDFFKIKD